MGTLGAEKGKEEEGRKRNGCELRWCRLEGGMGNDEERGENEGNKKGVNEEMEDKETVKCYRDTRRRERRGGRKKRDN